MTNPVSQFRNNLFGSRGMDIKSALDYVEVMIGNMSTSEQIAVRTAVGVLINTIDSAVTQSQGPSPEKMAIIDLIDERIAKHNFIREEAIGDVVDAHIHNLDDKIADWMDNNLRDKMMDVLANEDISDDISNWMSNNFDLNDYNVDYAIESWADNNLDEKISEAVNNLTFTVNVN